MEEISEQLERLEYPRREDGTIRVQDSALANRLRHLREIPADQPGGVDWAFGAMFGGIEQGVALVESLVAGQGDKADRRWVSFLLGYRSKCEENEAAGLPAPSLNSIVHAMQIPANEFLATVTGSLRTLNVTLGQVRIAQSLPLVVEAAVAAALDPERGGKDREILMKIAGLIESSQNPGIQVNVNQQVAVRATAEDLKTPLRRFRREVEDLDDIARGTVVEGEIVDETDIGS